MLPIHLASRSSDWLYGFRFQVDFLLQVVVLEYNFDYLILNGFLDWKNFSPKFGIQLGIGRWCRGFRRFLQPTRQSSTFVQVPWHVQWNRSCHFQPRFAGISWLVLASSAKTDTADNCHTSPYYSPLEIDWTQESKLKLGKYGMSALYQTLW